MRGFFNGLILGIVLGAIGYWYFQKKAAQHPEAEQRYQQSAAQLRDNAEATAHSLSDAMRAKLDTLDLNSDQVKDELSRSGQVFRRKAQDIGDKAADAASDARAVVEIKAKYARDSSLSAWDIAVNCDHGHVKLSGSVPSSEDIGRAVALALDADGVRDVTSTLVVKPRESGPASGTND